MKIANYELFEIETGSFALDGGSMFGIVPKTFWEKTNPPDEKNRIELAARCLLAIGNGKIILIDSGNGEKYNSKRQEIFKFNNSQFSLERSLNKLNISADDITDLILTHLHFDHCGGNTKIENGNIIPTFKNAIYHVQRNHWDWANDLQVRDAKSFLKENFEIINSNSQLNFIDGEKEIFPNINLIISNGHTTSLQLPLISDAKSSLLFCADLMPTISHLPLTYGMAFDLRPLEIVEEKKKIFTRAAKEKWILFSEHDPIVKSISIKEVENNFAIDEINNFE